MLIYLFIVLVLIDVYDGPNISLLTVYSDGDFVTKQL